MNVVNKQNEPSWHAWFVTKPALRDRLLAAYNHGRNKGFFKNYREWALKAELSENYVTSKLAVLKKKPTSAMHATDSDSLAIAAGISPRWLSTGEGAMLGAVDGPLDVRATARAFWLVCDEQIESLSLAFEFLAEFDQKTYPPLSAPRWLLLHIEEFREWRKRRSSTDDVVAPALVIAEPIGPTVKVKRLPPFNGARTK